MRDIAERSFLFFCCQCLLYEHHAIWLGRIPDADLLSKQKRRSGRSRILSCDLFYQCLVTVFIVLRKQMLLGILGDNFIFLIIGLI